MSIAMRAASDVLIVWQSVQRAWVALWFRDAPTSPLELTRIGIGAALFINYALATPYLFDFWGEQGLVPRTLVFDAGNWKRSVLFYTTAPWQLVGFHAVFLFCALALMLGWRTRWVKWLVLIGQLSYAHRDPVFVYGVDQVLACLLFILALAPIGRAISLDRVRQARAAKRIDIESRPPRYTSPWAGACTRLMQIQMAIILFFSALHKIRGNEWWNGDAIWLVFSLQENYYRPFLAVLAHHYWLVNFATYATILIEIGFPFLIWQRRTRPYMLAAAIFLHLNIAVFMGMPYFSFVMIMGHMSFIRPEWIEELSRIWKHKMGAMEMVYDGKCGFCVRSMIGLLAFDGLGQITTRNFRVAPSPVVSDAKLEKALYLALPDGRALPGFEAYRYVVLRVPGLWGLIPLFYLPVLSRLFGHPIYNWIAANRSKISGWI
jgi:predicted DCC family thiol-disulfide oxidoreductase YuxK